jgi:hypothetical protein
MNNGNARTELFAALQSLAEKIPQMRAGQLMAALGELCSDLHGRGLWDAEDAELIEAVWRFHRDIDNSVASASDSSAEQTAAAGGGRGS